MASRTAATRLANAQLVKFTDCAADTASVLKISWGQAIIDGNLGATHKLKNPHGTVVGSDYFGNVYMEDMKAQYGRHRWVVYRNHDDYADGPTTVPPEWHTWLHHMSNEKGPEVVAKFPRPSWGVPAEPSKTGTPECYKPKGAWGNESPRVWTKYASWKP
mmetsp:Transcript_6252/g.8460  ORF Transcript_6252/g.8460 Transcript_6252/m.8460 type:complete len:160 (-) Transcript_6252:188-667(-)|eukprot:CAMPEP_0196572060 /NCGR_PEP_ID=MMETSP1081-20130531/2178_1 /TAXON_ID=36882 /ORGANISM="Pyramimonas amylifera, Strain CCMP720" /LENGTH=159 /DNA_ID=CAMNT_0041889247 /DNA_START=81 /DNA_END=560 /DNA_ORIENTATION=+